MFALPRPLAGWSFLWSYETTNGELSLSMLGIPKKGSKVPNWAEQFRTDSHLKSDRNGTNCMTDLVCMALRMLVCALWVAQLIKLSSRTAYKHTHSDYKHVRRFCSSTRTQKNSHTHSHTFNYRISNEHSATNWRALTSELFSQVFSWSLLWELCSPRNAATINVECQRYYIARTLR